MGFDAGDKKGQYNDNVLTTTETIL